MTMIDKTSKDFASDEDVAAYSHMNIIVDIREYPEFYEIEEKEMLSAWFREEKKPQEEENDYLPILNRAKFFSKHGLTPIYFIDPIKNNVFVTSQEFLNGKLN